MEGEEQNLVDDGTLNLEANVLVRVIDLADQSDEPPVVTQPLWTDEGSDQYYLCLLSELLSRFDNQKLLKGIRDPIPDQAARMIGVSRTLVARKCQLVLGWLNAIINDDKQHETLTVLEIQQALNNVEDIHDLMTEIRVKTKEVIKQTGFVEDPAGLSEKFRLQLYRCFRKTRPIGPILQETVYDSLFAYEQGHSLNELVESISKNPRIDAQLRQSIVMILVERLQERRVKQNVELMSNDDFNLPLKIKQMSFLKREMGGKSEFEKQYQELQDSTYDLVSHLPARRLNIEDLIRVNALINYHLADEQVADLHFGSELERRLLEMLRTAYLGVDFQVVIRHHETLGFKIKIIMSEMVDVNNVLNKIFRPDYDDIVELDADRKSGINSVMIRHCVKIL
jgi:hypothetical protein